MPGYKVFLQDGGEIFEGLICSYCKLVLKDPVQTTESGQRFCKECYKKATGDPSFAGKLDQNDTVWPDCGAKKEIGNLKVKCGNYNVGCEWKGSFKQLMDDHIGVCPNAPKACATCKKEVSLADHMINQCKHIRCVCKEDGNVYEAGSAEFSNHLQDVSKLGDHLGPMICEFTKMSKAFKEMTVAYQQATKRIDTLEKRNDTLEKLHQEDVQRIQVLENSHQMLEKRNKSLTTQCESMNESYKIIKQSCDYGIKHELLDKVQKLEKGLQKLETNLHDVKRSSKDHFEFLAQLQDTNTAATVISSGDKVVPYEKLSESVKQLEKKVVEVDRNLTNCSVHYSELELYLQGSLASTHNGVFLWRIPEVCQRVQDARIGRMTSIYSPPFYTGRNGYKMCIRVFLNGDGAGKGTHLSIFFVLMKGEYDVLLQWPFDRKVNLTLVDQDHRKHIVQSFKPMASYQSSSYHQSSSFHRPKTDMNVASGCPMFVDLSVLYNPRYVKDNVMYIKAIVDTSDIFHP